MNMKQWVADVIANPHRIAIPIMTHPGIEYLNKTVREAVTNGRVHSDAICALNNIYPAAACTVIMDLTVEAEAFGAEVVFSDDEIPTVKGRLVYDRESVEQLTIPDINSSRVPEYILANKLTVERIKDKPVLGGCIGPFSLAGRLFDMSELMMACYTEPDVAEMLLTKCTEFLKDYVLALKKQGINGIIIAEPAAGLLSPDGCQEFSSKYVKEIIELVQDDEFLVILHNCGNIGHCTEAMLNTGAMGYHFGNMMDMKLALEQCPSNVLVMGNLDPVGLFKNATPQQMKEATLNLLHQTDGLSNFVISSGCDVPPLTPDANIRAFYEGLEEYNYLRL
ncbi:MAG: uroporphyrinogen decarboxylase family protein [Dysgonomonas sp.]|nr:uroporphyrinogen decarboxylase family protein [Dysgonomonas sp.]